MPPPGLPGEDLVSTLRGGAAEVQICPSRCPEPVKYRAISMSTRNSALFGMGKECGIAYGCTELRPNMQMGICHAEYH